MENPQNLPPSLLAFVLISLVLCIWAIVDIFRSKFTRFSKVMWLLIVLFAPFGIFVYLLIGRRMKPVGQGSSPQAGTKTPYRTRQETHARPEERVARWGGLATIVTMAFLGIILYLNVVSAFGNEKTGWFLLAAMVIVAVILAFFHFSREKGGL